MVLRYNQEESHHAQMSVAVYKINTGHLQGHLEGARHTQTHVHTYTQRAKRIVRNVQRLQLLLVNNLAIKQRF